MENVIFWLILTALFQPYGLFGVLLLAEILQWCTKIDKYQVWIAPLCRLTIFPRGDSLFNGQHDLNERKTSGQVQINIGIQPKWDLLILNSSDTLHLKNFLVNETGRA